jgi:hypothetical protein
LDGTRAVQNGRFPQMALVAAMKPDGEAIKNQVQTPLKTPDGRKRGRGGDHNLAMMCWRPRTSNRAEKGPDGNRQDSRGQQ